MRKSVLISWLIIIISFCGLFVSSIVYENDAFFTMINFKFEIFEAIVVKNDTDDIVSLRVSASIWNPSRVSSIRLQMVRGYVLLNSQGSTFLKGAKWFSLNINPQENESATWAYSILPQDVNIFNEAATNGIWNWYFDIEITIVSHLVGNRLYDRSQSFSGVKFITI
jgi:hypothetical protein